MVKEYKLEWTKGNTKRYYVNGTGISVQIGRYRQRDKYEKDMKIFPKWAGKWYVDVFNYGQPKLFNTQKQAKTYLKKKLISLYNTKQLRRR